jgi:basic membrane protein A and related proteins
MTYMTRLLGAAAALAITAGAANADPALIYDLGGKFDKSFNEAAFNGAERFKAETGGNYRDIEISSEAQREQALRRFAEAGFNPVVTTGFSMAGPISTVAPDFPDVKFVTIDGFVDPAAHPNVLSILFKEHEGSYLVGMAAAMASQSGTVGFVGGMDIPLIRKFACGYAQGVKAVNPDATVVANFTGTTPAAWNDPVKGGELTRAQISQGADVVFAAAGGTGLGVLQTAADAGIKSDRRRLEPELPPPRLGPDLHAQARGRGRVRGDVRGRRPRDRRAGPRPRRRGRGLRARREQRRADHGRDAHRHRRRAGADHLGRARGPRLHDRRQLPGAHLLSRGMIATETHAGRPDTAAPAIELRGISKAFGPVQANKDISIRVMPGTIHGIIGENGAGKSTLMSILYGFYKADAGEIFIRGNRTEIPDSQAAIRAGIGMVFQHFKLVQNFTVLENVVLGAEDGRLLRPSLAKARTLLQQLSDDYELSVDPDALIEDIGVGMQQRVEILKALYRQAEILILDEPTGVLTPPRPTTSSASSRG